jgi:6-hydroxytryprostatin B O-methyltransferase
MAMTGGILTEPRTEHIAHTRISAHFITQPVFNDWVLFMMQYLVPTTLCFSQATEKWGDTTATHQTAHNLAFKTALPSFTHIEQSQHSTEKSARYMRAFDQNPGLAIEHLLTGFDWEGLGSAHIVDL